MRKLMKIMIWLDIMLLLVLAGILIAEKEVLSNNIIRLHVVAASDDENDQTVKLQVRDAIIDYLNHILVDHDDAEQVKEQINAHLKEIEDVANRVLEAHGFSDVATVSLKKEGFPIRHYDTFSLPSGVYDSLRVSIGPGEGRNWWCVVFPSLCLASGLKDAQVEAAGAGFSRNLINTIYGKREYKLSFFFLDCIGKVENLFYKG